MDFFLQDGWSASLNTHSYSHPPQAGFFQKPWGSGAVIAIIRYGFAVDNGERDIHI